MSEWISVEDRLPEEEVRVLIYWEGGGETGIDIEKITNPKDENLWACVWRDYVKFWMPLPNPPSDDSKYDRGAIVCEGIYG